MRILKLEVVNIKPALVHMFNYPLEVIETDEDDYATLWEWLADNGYEALDGITMKVIDPSDVNHSVCDILKIGAAVTPVAIYGDVNQLSEREIELLSAKSVAYHGGDESTYSITQYVGAQVEYYQGDGAGAGANLRTAFGSEDDMYRTKNFYQALYTLKRLREKLPEDAEMMGICQEQY